MGTLLALLLGFATAYYIFLKESLSKIEEHSQDARFAIADSLKDLETAFYGGVREIGKPPDISYRLPPWYTAFADPDIERLIRETYPDTPDVTLGKRVAIDLRASDFEPDSRLRALTVGSHPNLPWQGRLYYWLICRSVDDLTLTRAGHPAPSDAFPRDPAGVGFDAWAKTYAEIRQELLELRDGPQNLEGNFLQFIDEVGISGTYKDNVVSEFKSRESAIMSAIRSIDQQLDLIAKDALVARRYDTSRLSTRRFSWTIGLAFLVGVVGPLIALLTSVLPSPRLTSAVLLIFSLGLVVAATVELVAATRSPETQDLAYRTQRWHRLLVDEVGVMQGTLDGAGMVRTDVLDAAVRSDDVGVFSLTTIAAIRDALDAARSLNKAADSLNSCTHQALSDELGMTPSRGDGGFALSAIDLIDGGLYDSWRRQFPRAQAGILVSKSGPQGEIRDVGVIRIPTSSAAKSALLTRMDNLQNEIVLSSQGKEFLDARRAARAALESLKVAIDDPQRGPSLDDLLRPKGSKSSVATAP